MRNRLLVTVLSMLLLANVGFLQAAAPVSSTIWLHYSGPDADDQPADAYVEMDPGRDNALIALNSSSVGTNEQFIVVDAGSGNILLKSVANSMYAIADTSTTSNILRAETTSTTEPLSLLEWIDNGDGTISLYNSNLNKYVKVQGVNQYLKVTRAGIESDTKFTWGVVGGIVDTEPPEPNPATFSTAPIAVGSAVITMTATTGSDATPPIQYYFAETSGNPGGTDSGWQSSSSYTDGGLSPETEYTYTVTMRDAAPPTPNVGLTSGPASATTNVAVVSEMPNIVFMYADDFGFADLSCYGHPYAKTPAIDKLATEGTRFTQAYSTGRTCLPSRTGYMTGRAPQRNADHPVADYGFDDHITITKLLNNHGYRTGHFGKWHIGPQDPPAPGTYGIDEIDTPSDNPGDALDGRDGELYNNAIAFIENHTQNHPGVPFYVNIWGHSTHYAVNPPAQYIAEFAGLVVDRDDFFTHVVNPYTDEMGIQEQFDNSIALDPDLDTSMQNYVGDVWSIDLNVARVLDTLDQLGLAENTIVVFSGDQGPAPTTGDGDYKKNMLGYSGIYRGNKGSQYEGNNRVPFIIRWPGHIDPNVVDSENVISGMDWLPTLCSIVGIEDIPDTLDGEDVSDIWFGATRPRVKTLFWASVDGGVNISIRKGNWKLHHNVNDTSQTETELYDLSIDPSEDNNVKADFPAVADGLVADIEAWYDYVHAPCDTDYSADIAGGYGVDIADFAAVAARWYETDCGATDDCQCADINRSGTVDIFDLCDLVEVWLRGT